MPCLVATTWRARRSAGSGRRSISPADFKVVEKIGHDRAVDAEVLSQGQLAADRRLGRGSQHLVAPGTAWQFGHGGVRGRDVGPEDHAETPAEIVRQRVFTAGGPYQLIRLAGDLAHAAIIRGR